LLKDLTSSCDTSKYYKDLIETSCDDLLENVNKQVDLFVQEELAAKNREN
jgi:hypothetical protein